MINHHTPVIKKVIIPLIGFIFCCGCGTNYVSKTYEKEQLFNRFYLTNNQSMAIMYPVGQEGVVERATVYIENAIKSKGYYAIPAEFTRQLMLEAGIDSGDELWEHRYDANPQLKELLGSDLLVYPTIKSFRSDGSLLEVSYELEIHRATTGELYYKYACFADAVPPESSSSGSSSLLGAIVDLALAVTDLTFAALFATYADYNIQILARNTAEKCVFNIPVGPFHDIYLADSDNRISISVPEDKADDLTIDEAMNYTSIREHFTAVGKGAFLAR